MAGYRARRDGFSIVELVAALVLLAVLAAVATSAMFNDTASVVGEAAVVKAHLRFAQAMAMANTPSSWDVQIQADRYTLRENGSAAGTTLPGEASSTRVLPSGISITQGQGTLLFDERGSPGVNDYTVVLNGQENIVITRQTGFIP